MKLRTKKELNRPVRVVLVSYDLPGNPLPALLADCAADLNPRLTGARGTRIALRDLATRLRAVSDELYGIVDELPASSAKYNIEADGVMTMPTERAELIRDLFSHVWVDLVDKEEGK